MVFVFGFLLLGLLFQGFDTIRVLLNFALGRRNLVLDVMMRQGYITEAEAEAAKAFPLPRSRGEGEENEVAPYFVEWVQHDGRSVRR